MAWAVRVAAAAVSEARCELAVLVGVQSAHELVELRGVGPLLEVDRFHGGHELLARHDAVVVQIERLERLADRPLGVGDLGLQLFDL